jgi:Ni/Co efflux regulator RcnB
MGDAVESRPAMAALLSGTLPFVLQPCVLHRTECRVRLMVYWTQAMNEQEGLMEKKHLIIPALLTALLSASASGFAQDRYHGDRDRDRGDRYSQRDRDDDRNRQYDRQYDRRDERRDDRRDGYQARGGGRYGNEGWGGDEHRWNGAGPEHSFRRGDRLPSRYRNHQYVVNNYREHHLRPPPRGYHWVQTGSDYVLAAIATGVIADLIINH